MIAVTGTKGADVVGAAGDAIGTVVSGLQATVTILGQEQANERLTLNGLGGNDVVDATSLRADAIQLAMNNGSGADACLGSEGGDLVNGGDGADLAMMGAPATTPSSGTPATTTTRSKGRPALTGCCSTARTAPK